MHVRSSNTVWFTVLREYGTNDGVFAHISSIIRLCVRYSVVAPGGFLETGQTLPAINFFTAERSATRAHSLLAVRIQGDINFDIVCTTAQHMAQIQSLEA